ncbi:hypothetical protein RHMOL_Rhmol01G0217100 [Rhododendron molle]|uniref:Uncharacterized protein n=1 Tax=Rhododendron molle TaxID=49168 RepID=A0ACC0Q4C5_RHOML|nr:hypothetical protein RHMOL_Rhmol01G0217100 [Rhododendron molle]
MELEQLRMDKGASTTFDELSMERSKSFVKALQELKNLRPQLYSAAEYCEKSYLHSDQKQMVLDNLKDYAVRTLVNAVDHLGTVAYKLTDLLDQQSIDVSTMELKVLCLNQQLLTCQTYTNKEGLRQQQLLALIPRHHKHYILPSPPANTLSWHLESETKSTSKAAPCGLTSSEDEKTSGKTYGVFHLVDAKESTRMKSPAAHLKWSGGGHASSTARMDSVEGSRPLTPFRSHVKPSRGEIAQAPVHSKSLLSSFFVKHKTTKHKAFS